MRYSHKELIVNTFLSRDLSNWPFPLVMGEPVAPPPTEGLGLMSGQITVGHGTRIRVFDAEPSAGRIAYYLTPPCATKRDALANLQKAQLPAMKRPQYRYIYPIDGLFDPLSAHGEAIEDLNAELARHNLA